MALDLARLTLGPSTRLFGVRAAYLRPEVPDFWITGIFDRMHVEAFGADGDAVSTLRCTLGVRLAQFPAEFVPTQGDLVQVAMIAGRAVSLTTPPPAGATIHNWEVQDVQPDGEGGATLILSESAA